MISRDTIEEVKNRIDILEVIGDFITLKKAGKDYRALSPFTNEKTPSFYVVPTKGIFKDFSSGKGGDAITFVMEHESMDYPGAIRYLAGKYGISIEEDAVTVSKEEQTLRESLYIIMGFAGEAYAHNLWESEEGQGIGLSYFRMERGFPDGLIRKFALGYALEGWEHFCKAAQAKGYSDEVIEKSGLGIKKEGGSLYDRFRGRVIFPVHNLSGRIIAFGARIMGKEKKQPKYLNSPETEIYHKGDVLYGMYEARHAIRQQDACFLVEGYTDVLSMHQAEVENVVSSSGTALTEGQIRLIRRFTNNINILFDGDEAGIRAAFRGIDLILQGGLNVRVLLLPDGEDPDSYARKVSAADFQQYLKDNLQDFITFKVNHYAADSAGDPIKKAEAIREITKSIAIIPDPVTRAVYIKEASTLMGMAESVLFTELNKTLITERRKTAARHEEAPPVPHSPIEPQVTTLDPSEMVKLHEMESIRLLLNYADNNMEGLALNSLLLNELSDINEFQNPMCKEVFDAFVKAGETGEHIDSRHFMEKGTEQVRGMVSGLVVTQQKASPNWKKKRIYFEEYDGEKTIITHARRFKYRLIKLWYEQLRQQLKEIESEVQEVALLDKLAQLKEAEKKLAIELGIDSGKY